VTAQQPHPAVRVPATTANLGAGFDSFGAAVSLHLHARTVDAASQADRVVTTGEGADDLPGDDSNLVWRSFVRFCETVGVAVPDVALHVANDVPLERGLGSSSAAIVAGLSLARAATGVSVGDGDVARIATDIEGHPDNVVPAITGGLTASAVTDDGRLVIRQVPPHARLRPIALVPTQRQATSAARAAVPEVLGQADVARQAARAAHVLTGLAGVWPVDPELAGDRLHEPARLEVMTATADVVGALRDAGVHAWLSGAGPTVAGVVARRDTGVDGWLADLAEAHGWAVVALDWDRSGTIACGGDACAFAGVTPCVHCPQRAV
jgi:homoserine kinase